jgi:hypothetical protein
VQSGVSLGGNAHYVLPNGGTEWGEGMESHGAIARRLLGESDNTTGEASVARYLQRDNAIRVIEELNGDAGIQFDTGNLLTSTQWRIVSDMFKRLIGSSLRVDISVHDPVGFVFSGAVNTVGELKRILREGKL